MEKRNLKILGAYTKLNNGSSTCKMSAAGERGGRLENGSVTTGKSESLRFNGIYEAPIGISWFVSQLICHLVPSLMLICSVFVDILVPPHHCHQKFVFQETRPAT